MALDSVTDPRNLGAVVRSAAGFGAHGVVIPERRAAGMTASAWKTSAGAAARVPVAQAVNLTRQLKAYQEAGCMVVGLAADGDVSLPDLDLADGPLVIVVGSEGKGLSRLVAETCDQLVVDPDGQLAGVPQRRSRRERRPVRRGPAARRRRDVVDTDARSAARTSGARPPGQLARPRAPVRVLGYVLAWAVVALPAWVLLFTHSSAELVLASHDAVVRPTLTGRCASTWAPTCRTSGRRRRDRIGVAVEMGKTTATTTPELAQRYAAIAARPEAEEGRVTGVIAGLALDAALRAVVIGLVPIGLWALVGQAPPRRAAVGQSGVRAVGCWRSRWWAA